jgi:(S)-2-hydroxyglutarate dehydrogenase
MQIVVIGAGLVGLGTAYALAEKMPRARITILEKEAGPARHQSSHNSGVLHAGLYYKPGSLKARLSVGGIRKMKAFCERNQIPFETCGKLVVATNDLEKARLIQLAERGRQNGLADLRLLEPPAMREIEPNVAGILALHVPEEGIVDYPAVARRLVELLEKEGHRIVCNAEVKQWRESPNGWRVETMQEEFEADYIVNCGGLQSDRVAALSGQKPPLRIVPFRGEYYRLKRPELVKNLIYPVPDPVYPFLGVHFSRLIHGGVEAGPNAVLAGAREGYRRSDFNRRDLWDALSYGGLWRFLAAHPGMCAFELAQSFSRRLFCQSLRKLVPAVQESDLETGGVGVRAQAMLPSGELVSDFYFIKHRRILHVLNAPSPAATASLAIGEHIAGEVGQDLSVPA